MAAPSRRLPIREDYETGRLTAAASVGADPVRRVDLGQMEQAKPEPLRKGDHEGSSSRLMSTQRA